MVDECHEQAGTRLNEAAAQDGTCSTRADLVTKSQETALWVANYKRERLGISAVFPPVAWVPAYVRCVLGRGSAEDKLQAGGLPYSLKGDVIAGLTVGAMLVPQSLAFALLAGLPVQIGLYASFAPLVVYACLGTLRQLQAGPTALMSLLTGQALDHFGLEDDADRVHCAAMLAVFVGCFSLLLGAARLGFIADLMSHSVMAAFCAAAGVTIGTSQMKHLLGIDMPRMESWGENASYLLLHIGETDPATCGMGAALLATLLFLKQWKMAGSAEKRAGHPIWRHLPQERSTCSFKVLKAVADLSSVLCVVLGWLWGRLYRQLGVTSVKPVGTVDAQGMSFAIPDGTILEKVALDHALTSAAVMGLVGFLESLAVGGKMATKARYEYVPNQELIALGCANIGGALMSGYPTTGSFSRTAVNVMFGATSLVACVLSSLLVVFAAFFLLDVVAMLPLASLAPIIIQGAIGVVNPGDFVVAWRADRHEGMLMVATFVVSLVWTVKEGLACGFLLSVLKTMGDLANPNLAVCGHLPDGSFRDVRHFPNTSFVPNVVVVRMDARLNFANSRKMKEFCLRAVQVRACRGEDIKFLVIDAKAMNHIDLTGCDMLEVLAEALKWQGRSLILANLKGPASKCLTGAHVDAALRREGGHLCIDMEQAMAIVRGEDAASRLDLVKDLASRVDAASKIIRNHAASGLQCACRGSGSSAPKHLPAAAPTLDECPALLASNGVLAADAMWQVQPSSAEEAEEEQAPRAEHADVERGDSTAAGGWEVQL